LEELLEDGEDLSCSLSLMRYFGGAREAERAGLSFLSAFVLTYVFYNMQIITGIF